MLAAANYGFINSTYYERRQNNDSIRYNKYMVLIAVVISLIISCGIIYCLL